MRSKRRAAEGRRGSEIDPVVRLGEIQIAQDGLAHGFPRVLPGVEDLRRDTRPRAQHLVEGRDLHEVGTRPRDEEDPAVSHGSPP
jgi:hypothetical protein